MKKLKISFDVDGVLLKCIEYAVDLVNETVSLNPPLSVTEFTEYNPQGERTSLVTPYYGMEDFVTSQPPYEGAQELIQWVLDQGHEVFFVTAVPPNVMSARATQLVKLFPGVPATNIIMATRKELVRTDIHVDDAPHNIEMSNAQYPVLFRRIWNQDSSGVLTINNYDELKLLINQIAGSGDRLAFKPSIICLVGPTGAGKKDIQAALSKNPLFKIPKRYTTRQNNPSNDYVTVTKEEFDSLVYRGDLFEYSTYGGHWFGMTEDSVSKILRQGKSAVLTVDMVGANSVKSVFPDKTITIFIRRSKEESISDVISREDITNEEKIKRLSSLETELRNEELCDFVVLNNGTTDQAVKQIMALIGH